MKFLNVFDPKSSTPSINRELGTVDQDLALKLAAYLKSGVPLISTTTRVPDVLSGELATVVPISTVTDGEYVWSLAVAHYVETHHVSPGEEFIAHCRQNHWTVSPLSADKVAAALAFVGSMRGQRA